MQTQQHAINSPLNLKYTSSRLLYASSLLVASGLVAGVLGYIFQIAMAHLLKNNEFSLFSTFNALHFILGSPLAALVMLLARRTALLQVDHQISRNFCTL